MKKRIMSMLLVIVMLVTMLCVPVSAEAMLEISDVEAGVVEAGSATNSKRYTVILFDSSDSMTGIAYEKQREATKNFVKKILKSEGTNYVAIVDFGYSIYSQCDFTRSQTKLLNYLDGLRIQSGTNTGQAFDKADELLSAVGSAAEKNIVLCSDGLPVFGESVYNGRYTSADYYRAYGQANAVYNKTKSFKNNKKYIIYTLGFFHNLYGNDLTFAKRFMKDIASPGKNVNVTNVEDVDSAFDKIATQIIMSINKTKLTLYVGGTATLSVKVNGKTKTATWKSSNTSVATVGKTTGKVTAKKAGTATITGTVDGKSVKCVVTVKKNPITLKLDRSSATVYKSKSIQLRASVTGTNSAVKWTTSDSSIATVSSTGKVTGKKAGKVTITATVGGKKATCTVTVKVVQLTHSVGISLKPYKSVYGKVIDEQGMKLQLNSGAEVKRCAAYLEKKGKNWYMTLAFTGDNITKAYMSGYQANDGKTLFEGGKKILAGDTYWTLNKLRMFKNSDGIWSFFNYSLVKQNYISANQKNMTGSVLGVTQKNLKVFYDKDKMIKWLKEQ